MPELPHVLAVASHPIQYFVPVYRCLASRGTIALRVLYCRDYGVKPTFDAQFGQHVHWDVDLVGGYEHRFLPNFSPISSTFNPLHAVNPTVVVDAAKWADVVWINGLLYPTNWMALAAAKVAGAAVLMRSELHPTSILGASARVRAKRAFYREALKLLDGVMAIGTQNRAAYRALGVPENRIYRASYVVDVSRFEADPFERVNRRERQRAEWKVGPSGVVVLFLGKLTPRKHPEMLCALDRARTAERLHLVWVGSGELDGQIKDAITKLRRSRGRYVGMVNQSRIPDVLWASDIFVFPAENEPWGLVLNEAMMAGLPAVVSRGVGAASDLCIDGVTGRQFDVGDEAGMMTAVDEIAADEEARKRMGMAALAHIAHWTPQRAAIEIEQAVLSVRARGTE